MFKIITPTRDEQKLYLQSFITTRLGNGKKQSKAYKATRRGYRDCY